MKYKMNKHICGLSLLVELCLSSCGVYQNYTPQKPDFKPLIANQAQIGYQSTPQEGKAYSDTTSFLKWSDFFTDPNLQQLIQEGLHKDSDLAIARLNIEQSMASLGRAKALFLPSAQLEIQGGASSYQGSKADLTYSLGASASWQIDLFNTLGNGKKVALAQVEERQAYTQAVKIQLIASIAQSYYTLEMLDAQMAVTQQTLTAWDKQISTLQALMQVGDANQGTIAQAEASKKNTEVALEKLRQQRSETENALCTLIGRPAGKIERGTFDAQALKRINNHGFDITCLGNRPDVRQAEATLKAAFYQTNVARSAFYPKLRLTGSTGWTNNGGGVITNPGALLWQAAASLVQPLLANGENKANLAIAKAQQQQAQIAFQRKVLDAGEEVNRALTAYQTANQVVSLQQQQIEKLQETLRTTQLQMEFGSTNALQVLIAQQSLLEAQLSLLSHQYTQLNSIISLYQSLGNY